MLDFIVIGAQKSGTTTLYEYLSSHSRILIPKGKEAPYFNRHDAGSYDDFISSFFPEEKKNRLYGKVSPQYMSSDEISERVCLANPEAKFIAILRDPVQRAISHFNMNVNRGFEARDIDFVIKQQLEPSDLSRARLLPGLMRHEKDCYVVWGEYDRILRKYLEVAGKNNLLIVYLEDLSSFPGETMKSIYLHLGVEPSESSYDLDKVYFKAGDTKAFHKIVGLVKKMGFRPLWRLIPEPIRVRLYFGVEQMTAKVNPSVKLVPSREVVEKLANHYKNGNAVGEIVRQHEEWFS